MPSAGTRTQGPEPVGGAANTGARRAVQQGGTVLTSPTSRHGNDRPAPPVRRQSTVLIRKKLPWLDGPEQYKAGLLPGHFESQESIEAVAASQSQPATSRPRNELSPTRKASVSSLGGDPALRAVGSTPSLRKRAKSAQFKTLSLSSRVRTGVVPPTSKEQAKQALGIVGESAKGPNHLSTSEYSTTPTSDMDEMPTKYATLHDGLFDRREATKVESREPIHVANQWLQSELDLPLEEPSPRYLQRPATLNSAELESRVYSPPKEPPRAKTLPRRSVAIPPPDPVPSAYQMAAPVRKPTLFAMPGHLLPSSSSSSWDHPPQAMTRQAEAAPQPPSQPLPRRATTAPKVNLTSRRQSQSLNRAVTGLENLMEEALNVARDAAQTGRNEEVANVLNSATLALRKASTVHVQMDRGQMSQPLRLSPPESRHHSDSDSIAPDSDASSTHSNRHSVETTPTMYTMSTQPSQQPVLNERYKITDEPPRSHKASFEIVRRNERARSPDRHSMTNTPPRLYQPPSADSIVRDFAYMKQKNAKAEAARALSRSHGEAEDYYGDTGQSVATQPGVRPSFSKPIVTDKPLPPIPPRRQRPAPGMAEEFDPPHGRRQHHPVRRVEHAPTQTIPPRTSSRPFEKPANNDPPTRHRRPHHRRPHHVSDFFESSYYHRQPQHNRSISPPEKRDSLRTDSRYEAPPLETKDSISKANMRYSGPPILLKRDISLRHPRRKHISLREGQGFSLGRYHRRKPIAREWNTHRKRITAMIACLNTVFVGLIAGIYAGEVPAMQYHLADTKHQVILGNVVLFACLGVTTIIAWPLPLLHGRKPYTLLAFALMLPLMFPQALVVSGYRSPYNPIYRCGLLIPRAFQGIAVGFANINFLPTLLDLFGASLMSDKPHQEIVVYDDVRRQGGGIGV